METKLSESELEKVKWKLGYRHGFGVNSDGRKGGLGILWGTEADIYIQGYNRNLIDCVIKEVDEERTWRFTLFYRDPMIANRHVTWELLKGLCQDPDVPWVIGGDFNEVVSNEEKTNDGF